MRVAMFSKHVGAAVVAVCLLAVGISAQGNATDDWGEVFGGTQTSKSNNARVAQKPAVVVGAVGQDPKPGLRKALETQIKEAFVKDGRYTAVTREEAVLTAVDNEQAHQRTGAVDDAQIKQIGKQSGAKYVCVVEIAPLMNSYTLSAQFVDIESANIASMASVTNMLRNAGDFLAASEELVRKLLGYTQQTPTAATTQKISVKHVAVIETKIDERLVEAKGISNTDLGEITTVLRREAVKNLPKDKFKVMTSETVQSMGVAMVQDCAEENCIVTIGSKIGADYIVRGTLSKIRERYSLTVELFETEYGNLVAVTPSPIRSTDLDELLDKSESVCAEMYRSFAGTGMSVATQAAVTTVPTANVASHNGQSTRAGTAPTANVASHNGQSTRAGTVYYHDNSTGEQKRGLYFDFGMGFGGGSISYDGKSLSDMGFDFPISVEVGMIKLGYGPVGNLPIFIVGEFSGSGHPYEYRIEYSYGYSYYGEGQFNSYLIGPGIIYYPIPFVQLGASLGYNFLILTGDLGVEDDGGIGFNISAAFDIGNKAKKGGWLLGIRYYGAYSDFHSSFYGVFFRYVRRHKIQNH